MNDQLLKLLGCTQEDMRDIEDESSRFSVDTDYNTSEYLLKNLQEANLEIFNEFAEKFLSIVGIDEFPLQKRLRFIEFLLTSYIDWGTSESIKFKTDSEYTVIIDNKVLYPDGPRIIMDFQEIFNIIKDFNPPKEAVEQWGEIFGNALKRRVPLEEVKPDIATGVGQKKKPGRKRQDK